MQRGRTRRELLNATVAGAAASAIGVRTVWARAGGTVARRLSVCSWSLGPTSLGDLLAKLAATGLTRVQIALDPIRANEGGGWSGVKETVAKKGITMVSGMLGRGAGRPRENARRGRPPRRESARSRCRPVRARRW